MTDKKMTQLAEPQAAIASYLDELLHTATDLAREQGVVEAVGETLVPVKTALAAPKPAMPRKIEPVVPKPVVKPVVKPLAPEPAVQAAIAITQPDPPPQSSARPQWAEQPFECLVFTVAGLQLAVPLVLLGAIHRIDDEIKPIPGSPQWYMGIRPSSDHNLRVVDSAQWIMAGRVPVDARAHYRFVIRLNNSDWGLACDNVGQSFTLSPQQVRWRSSRSKRPWLAGTVIEQMCALLDVQAMADLLARAEREQHLDLS